MSQRVEVCSEQASVDLIILYQQKFEDPKFSLSFPERKRGSVEISTLNRQPKYHKGGGERFAPLPSAAWVISAIKPTTSGEVEITDSMHDC